MQEWTNKKREFSVLPVGCGCLNPLWALSPASWCLFNCRMKPVTGERWPPRSAAKQTPEQGAELRLETGGKITPLSPNRRFQLIKFEIPKKPAIKIVTLRFKRHPALIRSCLLSSARWLSLGWLKEGLGVLSLGKSRPYCPFQCFPTNFTCLEYIFY